MISEDSHAYRPDIDGLRAVAVIPVILFHAGLDAFSGGYVGVDVFFVISGYLITGILLREISRGDFSISRFYARRVRRIFPALFLVLFAVTAAGWFLLLPGEYNDLGNALAAATFFYSNYHFMAEAGYFAAPAESQPLLHTWSLAVEEQFYIVFPLFLYLVARRLKGRVGAAIAVLAVLSLIYSVALVDLKPDSAFYSTPARGWELLLGAVLAAYPRRAPLSRGWSEVLAASGLAAIAAAVFLFTPATSFPGAAALVPCLGAAALIYAGSSNASLAGTLLATPLLRWPGLVSYSLYLWHWPVLVLYRLYVMRPLRTDEVVLLISFTVLAAWLSWRFVETPFRRRRLLGEQRPLLGAGAIAMAVALGCGIALSRLDGFPARMPPEVARILAAESDRAALSGCQVVPPGGGYPLRVCPVGDGSISSVGFAVWGDSHGEALLPAVDAAARRTGARGIYLGRDGCLPLLEARQVREGYEGCVDHARAVIDYLAGNPGIRLVFLVSRWGIYASGGPADDPLLIRDPGTASLSTDENKAVFRRAYTRTAERIRSMGRRLVFVEQVPEADWNIPRAAARAALFGRDAEREIPLAQHLALQSLVAGLIIEHSGAGPEIILQPWRLMCGGESCALMEDGVPLYRDSSHVTGAQASRLASVFEPVLRGVGPDPGIGTPPRAAQ